MTKKMTAVERENTKFNVIEVVTEFNVPQSAKVVLNNVRYHDLPKKLAEYLAPEYNNYFAVKETAKEIARRLERKWYDQWVSEQENDFNNYWMGDTAVDKWATDGEDAMQAFHYIFFQIEGYDADKDEFYTIDIPAPPQLGIQNITNAYHQYFNCGEEGEDED